MQRKYISYQNGKIIQSNIDVKLCRFIKMMYCSNSYVVNRVVIIHVVILCIFLLSHVLQETVKHLDI